MGMLQQNHQTPQSEASHPSPLLQAHQLQIGNGVEAHLTPSDDPNSYIQNIDLSDTPISKSPKPKKKKRKRHSRRQFEMDELKKKQNIQFLHFNNIQIFNNNYNVYNNNNEENSAMNHIFMLQDAIGLLKLYIEQLAIYTQRVKGLDSENKLKKMRWTANDVWDAVKRRQLDEDKYFLNEQQHKEEEKEFVHQSNDIDVGFEDIYESIVAYEYDIKSLCDAIMTEITSNDSLRDELEFAHRTSNDFKN